MKRKFSIFTECFLTIVLTIGIIYVLGEIVRPSKVDSALKTIDTFHDMSENSFEVIGYGSSHIWRGLDMMELYNEYGIGGFNYGCTWQYMNTTNLFLKDSLRTQKPKVALIETYNVDGIRKDMNVNGEIYYTRNIPYSEGKKQYLKQCFGNDKERYLSYYMPLCAFHENWVNVSKENFIDNSSGYDFDASMGYYSFSNAKPVKLPNPNEFNQKQLGEDSLAVLDEMVQICKENDIEIIFFTTPYVGTYEYGEAMEKYAKENDCVYFNFFEYIDELGIDGNTDFSDETHLNSAGAKKITDFLGAYMIEHYDLTDMRTVENNLWEERLH
ncbi:MAG: hypothetical protein ACI4F4_05510 [Lachnospiraceae bacterium]